MDDEEHLIIVPHEDHVILVPAEDRDIEVPADWRVIEISKERDMLITSKRHTAGDTIRWKVDYDRWLDNAATIDGMAVISSSNDLTIANIQLLGRHIYFFLTGGNVNEQVILTLTMTDNFGNIKHDTLQYTVVTP